MTTPSNTSSSTSKSNSTTSSITSKNCGQKALLPVLDPSPNKNSILNNLSDFALPSETLQSDERSLISDSTVGIEVLKVTKVRKTKKEIRNCVVFFGVLVLNLYFV